MKPELAAQAEHWLGVIQLDRHSYPEAETLLVANADPLFAKIGVCPMPNDASSLATFSNCIRLWTNPKQPPFGSENSKKSAKPRRSAKRARRQLPNVEALLSC